LIAKIRPALQLPSHTRVCRKWMLTSPADAQSWSWALPWAPLICSWLTDCRTGWAINPPHANACYTATCCPLPCFCSGFTKPLCSLYCTNISLRNLWCTAFNPGTLCKPWQTPGLKSVRLCQVAFINGRIMEFASTVEAAEGCSLAHPVNEAAQVGTDLLQDRLWWQ